MAPRSLRIGLSLSILAALAARVIAQQPDSPYPIPLPSTLPPPADTGPLSPGVAGWPAEELVPAQPTTPPTPPIVGEDATIAQMTESWIEPSGWFFPGEITGGVELGLNGSDGNSEALSFKTGFNLNHKTDIDELAIDLAYNNATADGVQTAHNSQFNASYERKIKKSKWSLFVKESMFYDEFKPYDLRIAINGGIGYEVIKTDLTTWRTRFGAGGSTEIGGPTDDWVPEGVFGTDFERKLSDRQKFSFTSDYFPDWSDFANYRIVTKVSYEVLINEEHNLNLKLTLNDQYDSTPNGAKPNDIFYSVVLLWKK